MFASQGSLLNWLFNKVCLFFLAPFRIAGITHIISDGCHRIQPHDAGDNGQLYTIHGIAQFGQAVPLLHSYLKDAKKVSYTYLFDVLRKVLNNYNCQIKDLTFVVDFERGAIRQVILQKFKN